MTILLKDPVFQLSMVTVYSKGKEAPRARSSKILWAATLNCSISCTVQE